jgi:hypothetical protein
VGLSFLGAIVAGIWLAILGMWIPIIMGILLMGSASFLAFLLLPSSAFLGIAMNYAKKGNIFGLLSFQGLGILYIDLLVTAWCCSILFFFHTYTTNTNSIPILIWSFNAALCPWIYMLLKEPEDNNKASLMTTSLTSIAYITVSLLIFLTHTSYGQVIGIFFAFMIVDALIKMRTVYVLRNEIKEINL